MEAINLFDNRYALRFPYYMVTETTVFRALPRELMGKKVKFAQEESDSEAGTKRMDSELMQKTFPIEYALLNTGDRNPKDYIIIEVAA